MFQMLKEVRHLFVRWLCHIFGRLHRGSNECSSAMRYTYALRDPRSLGASAAETSASASFIFLSDDQVVVFVFVRTGSIYNRVLLDGFRSGG